MRFDKLLLWSVITFWAIFQGNISFAAFEQDNNLPSIAICDVKSYGETSLKPEFFATFEELLQEKLYDSKKLRIEPNLIGDCVLEDGSTLHLDDFFTLVHMEAIVNGKEFDRDSSCTQLRNYYDGLTVKPKHDKQVYYLNGELQSKVKQFGSVQNADYLLFVNLKSVDVIIKNASTALLSLQTSKGMKLKLNMDYYLINAKTGKVFEGTSFTDKTTQVFNVIVAKYGKQFTVQQLLHTLLEVQAERAASGITGNGLEEVRKID